MGETDHPQGTGKHNKAVKDEDGASGRKQNNQRRWKGHQRFVGKSEELKGNIYDASDPRTAADMFVKTTREIE